MTRNLQYLNCIKLIQNWLNQNSIIQISCYRTRSQRFLRIQGQALYCLEIYSREIWAFDLEFLWRVDYRYWYYFDWVHFECAWYNSNIVYGRKMSKNKSKLIRKSITPSIIVFHGTLTNNVSHLISLKRTKRFNQVIAKLLFIVRRSRRVATMESDLFA